MQIRKIALGAFLGSVFSAASAVPVTFTPITDVDPTAFDLMANQLLGASSGISIVPGTGVLINDPNIPQAALYSNFNLAPSSGTTDTLILDDGIFLTSGSSNILNNASNTTNNTTVFVGTGSNANLGLLSQSQGGTSVTNAQNTLLFDFTVDDPTTTSLSLDFVFGTEEFPTQSVTDIFGIFVDGVNFAFFPNGDLIANNPSTPFINNPVGAGLYEIEYNGLTEVLTAIGILDPNLTTHTLEIAIADTSDNSFDSGAFVAGLSAGTQTGGGGICQGPNCPTDPPTNGVASEPGTFALLGFGLMVVALRRFVGSRKLS